MRRDLKLRKGEEKTIINLNILRRGRYSIYFHYYINKRVAEAMIHGQETVRNEDEEKPTEFQNEIRFVGGASAG